MFRPRRTDSIVYGVTSGLSAWALLRGQLAGMKERGWAVVVVADEDERLGRVEEREGVRVFAIRMAREISPVADVRSLAAWVTFLSQERPAVTSVGTPKAALLGGFAAVITRVPRRVYVVRGLRYEGASGARRRLLIGMERLTVAFATDVVVVSRSIGHRLRVDGITRKPLLLIGDGSSNGVDGSGLAQKVSDVDQTALRQELEARSEDFIVGFVGRANLDKGIGVLTDALRRVRAAGVPVRLLVVGDAEDGAAANFLADVPDLSLTGWTDTPWKYLAVMDVLVLPTRREGYPNVVLEANSCGVPVVTTTATGAVDSVVDGETGRLVDVDDAAGLADALIEMWGDPRLRASMAAAAQDRALRQFRPERIWDGLDGIYRGSLTRDVQVIR